MSIVQNAQELYYNAQIIHFDRNICIIILSDALQELKAGSVGNLFRQGEKKH